jgi:predicted secreted protein
VQAIDQNKKSIHAKVNHPFTVRLWEDRTTAHRWHLEFDPSAFSLIDDDFQRTTMATTVDAGNRVFEFKALKAGTYPLNFMKRMGVVVSEVHRVFQIIVE